MKAKDLVDIIFSLLCIILYGILIVGFAMLSSKLFKITPSTLLAFFITIIFWTGFFSNSLVRKIKSIIDNIKE